MTRRIVAGFVLLLLMGASLMASHRYNYRFTYISVQRALFQCYNGQKPDVQMLDGVMVLECDGE